MIPGRDSIAGIFASHARDIVLTAVLLLVTMLAGIGLLGLSAGFLTASALTFGILGSFNFFSPSAGIRGLTMLRILSRYAEKLAGHAATLRIARDLRVWLFARIARLTPSQLGSLRGGDLLARLLDDIAAVDGWLVRGWAPLAALALATLTVVSVMAWIHPAAGAWMGLIVVLIALCLPLLVVHGQSRHEVRRAQSRAALRADTQEFHEGSADLAALGATQRWLQRVQGSAEQLAKMDLHRRQRLLVANALQQALGAIGLVGTLWLVCAAVLGRQLQPAHAAGLVFAAMAVLELAAGAGMAWQALLAARASAQRIDALAGQSPTVCDPEHPQPLPAEAVLTVDDVRFGWRQQQPPVLEGLSLRLIPGERIAIRGDSGSGKSTLAALLLRSVDPQAGNVRYGAVDLRATEQAQWLQRLAWLPQSAPVFAGSVRDNLALGADVDDARMQALLAQLQLGDWLAQVGGLDAWIGENGATLSAGQARRLALARALLREAPMLVLDEPTEGLDHDAALDFLRQLPAWLGRRSLVLITHGPLPAGTVHRVLALIDGRLRPC